MGGNGGHEEVSGSLCVIEEKKADEQSALHIKENGVAHFAARLYREKFLLVHAVDEKVL